ncbi:hypothetical protein [Sporomusa sp. KB1]|jgi:hypothetical protein|uniref:hypothetical protein n=1 Tax=Sporomusa sp. KB1 TaxID=943346 RepID=UPI0011AAC182|nr:hypothetical protein [Sporomusa sp. KB1]TWH49228.1 hypothetical protein Salpa_5438 [Sporomusa sp. KB1]
MNVLRWGSRMLSRTTPAGLILTGAAIALATPVVRRGLRSTALLATKGVLAITDQTKGVIARFKEDAEDFMAEARTTEQTTTREISNKWDEVKDHARRHRRRILAATATGVVAMSGKAKKLKHEFHDAIEEAKGKGSQGDHSAPEPGTHQHERDNLATDPV